MVTLFLYGKQTNKQSTWELWEQDEDKETRVFVRPFYLLILPALFLSVLSPGLNCFGFAL